MIVYEANKTEFLHHSDFDDIEDIVRARYTAATGRRVPLAELRSWKSSLTDMAKVLQDPDFPKDMIVRCLNSLAADICGTAEIRNWA